MTDDPANIGYYSGLVDSCFAIAQVMTVRTCSLLISSLPHTDSRAIQVYQWSKWSDRIGRKPILIAGLVGVALSSFCFGLSESLVCVYTFPFHGPPPSYCSIHHRSQRSCSDLLLECSLEMWPSPRPCYLKSPIAPIKAKVGTSWLNLVANPSLSGCYYVSGFVTDIVRSSSVAFSLLGVIWPIGCIM